MFNKKILILIVILLCALCVYSQDNSGDVSGEPESKTVVVDESTEELVEKDIDDNDAGLMEEEVIASKFSHKNLVKMNKGFFVTSMTFYSIGALSLISSGILLGVRGQYQYLYDDLLRRYNKSTTYSERDHYADQFADIIAVANLFTAPIVATLAAGLLFCTGGFAFLITYAVIAKKLREKVAFGVGIVNDDTLVCSVRVRI